MALLKYANRFGFPCIESTSVTSDGTNTTVSFNPHQNGDNFFGGFWVKIGQNVATSTEPLQSARPFQSICKLEYRQLQQIQ